VEYLTLVDQPRADLLEQVRHLTSRLGHDLRSPLHLVAGYADLLDGESFGPLTAEQKQFVKLIRRGATTVEQEIDSSLERPNTLIRTDVKL
jgi:signal transduction histidine kinase